MRKSQKGRSMIEMLGVLAIIGVLSIGGIALYRRAVNNHHANTILDDVNRFAFVITEKGNYPLGEDLPKGDFKESGIYELTGHQAAGAGQFSILVSNVPKGVCEALVDKAHIEYKVGVVAAGGSVDDETLYDSLHTDLCQDMNDVAFYFGDTSAVCNTDENEDTPCTQNSDCCGGYFCTFPNATNEDKIGNGNGQCKEIKGYIRFGRTLSDGQRWVQGAFPMNGWTARSLCDALGMSIPTMEEFGCPSDLQPSDYCSSDTLSELYETFGSSGYHWIEEFDSTSARDVGIVSPGKPFFIGKGWLGSKLIALCH